MTIGSEKVRSCDTCYRRYPDFARTTLFAFDFLLGFEVCTFCATPLHGVDPLSWYFESFRGCSKRS